MRRRPTRSTRTYTLCPYPTLFRSPPADELVLVSGMAPIRAKKLRYFKDRNFRARLVPPPTLGDGEYPDRPQGRPDDWSGYVRAPDSRLDRKSTRLNSSH